MLSETFQMKFVAKRKNKNSKQNRFIYIPSFIFKNNEIIIVTPAASKCYNKISVISDCLKMKWNPYVLLLFFTLVNKISHIKNIF